MYIILSWFIRVIGLALIFYALRLWINSDYEGCDHYTFSDCGILTQFKNIPEMFHYIIYATLGFAGYKLIIFGAHIDPSAIENNENSTENVKNND